MKSSSERKKKKRKCFMYENVYIFQPDDEVIVAPSSATVAYTWLLIDNSRNNNNQNYNYNLNYGRIMIKCEIGFIALGTRELAI